MHHLEAHALGTLWCDDGLCVILPVEVWQVPILGPNPRDVLVGHVTSEVLKVFPLNAGHASCLWGLSWFTRASDLMMSREVSDELVELVLHDVGHASPHLDLDDSPLRAADSECLTARDLASSLPEESFWEEVDVVRGF